LGAQVIRAGPEGDFVLATAHSSELKEFGWKAACGNMPAAYLTGLLVGQRAKANGISEAILDLGLHSKGAGSRIFAATKGALDAGLDIPHEETVLPKKERVRGQHVAEYAKMLASEPEAQKKRFANYLKNKLKPEELPDHFAQVEAKINSSQKADNKA
jgi:large subunit ribosomal protein L18